MVEPVVNFPRQGRTCSGSASCQRARDMFVLSAVRAARLLGRDSRESGKRSNELQNCNTITAITRNARAREFSALAHTVTSRTIARSRSRIATNRQFILKLQHLEKLA